MDAGPIAIVGVSCRFAGAPNPSQFWRAVMDRKSMIAPLDADVASVVPGGKNMFGGAYPQYGAQLGPLYACVAREQVFPQKMNASENQDLYFINQLAFDALADAGMRPHETVARRGTLRLGYAPLFNTSTVNWLQHTFFIDQTLEIVERFLPNAPQSSIDAVRTRLVKSLPSPNVDSFLAATGHRLADRVARDCSLSGEAATLDSGAMSFISACAQACDDLRSARADVALAGAVMPPLSRAFLQGVSGGISFSTGKDLVPFDRDACGTIPGEGGAFFVLKRRADALRSHDHIYALIRSTAEVSSLSMSSPLLIACDYAQVPVHSIRLVEAHGSGIPSQDTAEISSLQSIWGEHSPGRPLVGVGSCKGNFGHCMRAGAAAGALKAALALQHRVLPPQIPAPHPREEMANAKSSVYLLSEARPWVTRDAKSPRRAVVLATSFSGRRAAMILEEEPEDRR